MSGSLLSFAMDVASVVLAALFGARVLLEAPRNRNAQLIALICITAICHVLLARYDYRAWIDAPYRLDFGAFGHVLNFVRNMAPGLFMILVYRLFADARALPWWLLALFALQLFLEEPVRLFLPSAAPSDPLLTEIAPTLLQTFFAGAALYWTIDNWRIDLVETRRRTRAVVLLVLGVDVVASSLFLRVLIPSETPANYEAHLVLGAVNLAIMAALVLRLMRGGIALYLDPDGTSPPPKPDADAMPSGETAAALGRLTDLLEMERVYRQPGLTLGKLAGLVALPEYRLRQLIHEQLGYRNFNAFLHAYRIREACERLDDPKLRRTPILTIALSVGYQSINTFNRGFREVKGMTPSAYRSGEGARVAAAPRNLLPKTE